MQHDESIVAVFAFMFVFGAPVVAFMVARVLRHQERLEMLRRGMMPPEFDKRAYRAWRKSGAPWPPPGATQAPWPAAQPAGGWNPSEDDPQRALFKGIRLALIGLALTLGVGIAFGGYSGNPVILFGLIPMFVGIAQIIIAVLSGAQLPGVMPQTTFIPPPQPPPGPGAPPPPGPGYGSSGAPPPWAGQPGRPRFEELSKPVPPPDVR